MYQSIGKLEYKDEKLVCIVDGSLVRYFRSLIPKYVEHRVQAYKPHITVVRDGVESPANLDKWGIHEGREINFEYEPLINFDGKFYSLRVESKELEEIREELGLTKHRIGFTDFHVTIARTMEEELK
jgi:2'-5' RNA ligase